MSTHARLGWLVAAMLVSAAGDASAQLEIQWWHAMQGANNDVIVKLADDFNATQKDYKVVPSYKGSYADTMNAGIAAFRAGHAPHIMQVFEVGTATMMAATGAIKPVHVLMKEAGEPFDPALYLPTVTGYYSTSKGEMLSMPFNSSSAVMWYNRDAFKAAGLDADHPPKTWPEVFAAAKKLKAAGHARPASREPRRAAEGQDLRLFGPHQHRRRALHLRRVSNLPDLLGVLRQCQG